LVRPFPSSTPSLHSCTPPTSFFHGIFFYQAWLASAAVHLPPIRGGLSRCTSMKTYGHELFFPPTAGAPLLSRRFSSASAFYETSSFTSALPQSRDVLFLSGGYYSNGLIYPVDDALFFAPLQFFYRPTPPTQFNLGVYIHKVSHDSASLSSPVERCPSQTVSWPLAQPHDLGTNSCALFRCYRYFLGSDAARPLAHFPTSIDFSLRMWCGVCLGCVDLGFFWQSRPFFF